MSIPQGLEHTLYKNHCAQVLSENSACISNTLVARPSLGYGTSSNPSNNGTCVSNTRVARLPWLCYTMRPFATFTNPAAKQKVYLCRMFAFASVAESAVHLCGKLWKYPVILWNNPWINIYFMWIFCGYHKETVILLAIASYLATAVVTQDARCSIDSNSTTPYNDGVQINPVRTRCAMCIVAYCGKCTLFPYCKTAGTYTCAFAQGYLQPTPCPL